MRPITRAVTKEVVSSVVQGPAGGPSSPAAFTTTSILHGGVDEAASIGDKAEHTPAAAMSLSCWVKGPGTQDYGGVALKHDFSADAGYAILRSGSTAGTARCIITDSGGAQKQYDTTVPVFDNTWRHIVMTFGSSALKIYVGGTENASPAIVTDGAVSSLRDSGIGFRVGSQLSGGTPSNFYTGNVCSISLWNVCLTAAEVSEIYNGGKPSNLALHSKYANCVSWWKYGDGDSTTAGSSIIDTKGGFHLTAANMEAGDIVIDAP